jgi:serine/threonine protein phosphatase 1
MSNRIFYLGDVHGCLTALIKLIAKLRLRPGDVVVFVGDLVDKGPDSVGVVRYVRELSEAENGVTVVLVEGNHEDKHRRFRKNTEVRPETAANMADKTPELVTITAGLSPEDIAFLDSAIPFYSAPDSGVLVVHAGIPGNMVEFPATVEEAQALTGKKKKTFNLIMRTRHVHGETGKMVQLGAETPEDPFWADVYDGRFGHVVFGHEPMMDGVGNFEHATGIDTGAVFGGQLTALVLQGENREVVSVQCEKYAEPMAC